VVSTEQNMKLWHNEWDTFVLADEQPEGFTLAENETGVDIFCYMFDSKEEARAEVNLVHGAWVDDINSTAYEREDGKHFVVTIDWCGDRGLMMQRLCDQQNIRR